MEPKLYIGANEVTEFTPAADGSLYTVKLSDGRTMEFTPLQWIAVQSEQPYDEGMISVRKFRPVVNKVMEIFLENNLKMGDISFVMQRIDENIVQHYRQAMSKKFEVDVTEHVPLKSVHEISPLHD